MAEKLEDGDPSQTSRVETVPDDLFVQAHSRLNHGAAYPSRTRERFDLLAR